MRCARWVAGQGRSKDGEPIGFRYLVRRKAPTPPGYCIYTMRISSSWESWPIAGESERRQRMRVWSRPRAPSSPKHSRPRLVTLPAGGKPDRVDRLQSIPGCRESESCIDARLVLLCVRFYRDEFVIVLWKYILGHGYSRKELHIETCSKRIAEGHHVMRCG